MKLSAQEEYGLRCLLHMASKGKNASVSIPEISRGEGLSIPNVAKLMRLLRIGGFVKSVRGQAGGYSLARPPAEITLDAVMAALGGRLFYPTFCEKHAGLGPVCTHHSNCSLRAVWTSVQSLVENMLRQLTIEDLLAREEELRRSIRDRPQAPIEPREAP